MTPSDRKQYQRDWERERYRKTAVPLRRQRQEAFLKALIVLGYGHLSVLTLTWDDDSRPEPFDPNEVRRRFGNLYERLSYWGMCTWVVGVLHAGEDVRGDLHIVLDLHMDVVEALIDTGPSWPDNFRRRNRSNRKLPQVARSLADIVGGEFGTEMDWRWANLDTQLGNSRGVISTGNGAEGTRRYLLGERESWKAVRIWKRGVRSRLRPGHEGVSVEETVGKHLNDAGTVFVDPVRPDTPEAERERIAGPLIHRAPLRTASPVAKKASRLTR